MAITSAEEFFALLEKSRLLTAEQWADARRIPPDGNDASALAWALVREGLLTRWQAAQLLAGRSSFFLGKYKLIDLLGRGGMGRVFLGEHTMMNRRVALKILSREIGKDPASVARFLSEARAIAALDHPNIVQAYSIDNEGDRYYLVMEYVDGPDLQRLVETDGPLDYQRAADYIRQAADGLAHAHQRNMIHCDIKPSNLLVNNQGVVKILDMGLARLAGGDPADSGERNKDVLGSVDYLAPEQALGNPDLDQRADIYSLGCTFYFLLTGHPPFGEGTLAERIVQHQTQPPRRISHERSDAPADLVQICERMMAKRPASRFQTAGELSQALAQWRPPERKPPRVAPLQAAPALPDTPQQAAAVVAAGGDAAPKALPAVAAADAPPVKVGLLGTTRRKVIAVALAVVAVAGLGAGTITLLVRPASGTGKNKSAGESAGRRLAEQRDPNQGAEGKQSAEKPAPKAKPSTSLPSEKPKTGPNNPEAKPDPSKERPKQPKEEPTPPKEEPKQPQEEPKEKPKQPEEEPQEKPKPEKPKKSDPLKDLAGAVLLPPISEKLVAAGQLGEAVALGQVHLASATALDIQLLGGKDAIRGNQQFQIEHDAAAGAGAAWLLQFGPKDAAAANTSRTDVARLWLDGDTLKLQWLEGAGRVRANYLRNCGLQISADGESRWLALNRGQRVEPLLLDFDRGVARVTLPPLEWSPDAALLRLQITDLEGPFPKHEFRPGSTIAAKGGTDILLAADKDLKITLRVFFETRGRVARIDVFPIYEVAGQQPQALKYKEAAAAAAKAFALLQKLRNSVDLIKDNNQKTAVKEQIKGLEKIVEQYAEMPKLYQALHRKGKIHYRVFVAVGDQRVELFSTRPSENQTPPEKKPQPKR